MSAAFRFFDRNGTGQITFDSFVMSLEVLRLRLGAKDQMSVFNDLDEGKKGWLNYQDFGKMSEADTKPSLY